MLSETDYLFAWLIYGLGYLVLMLCLWRFSTNWSNRILRLWFRLIPAVCLLVPARADVDQGYMAPAFYVAFFEYTLSADSDAGRQALIRIAYVLAAALICCIAALVWARRRSAR